ncbi:unnamed protein product [Ranitomeya imitator]|uniref:Ig-like domain-containing protein n=1 Tax=Ranitomeya imitator TaxID=111125 RepID=A0ABN9KU41_9NEOB|nr:unnamed protein product [Ranitomeya imitator]
MKGEKVALQCVVTPPTGSPLLYSFFRGSQAIQDYTLENTYIIHQAGEENSGNYKCSSKPVNNKVLKYSEDLSIVVTSTFDNGAIGKEDSDRSVGVHQPQLKILPEKVVVDDEVTLRCESSRSFFPMHYRFYHNGTILGNVTTYQKGFAEMRHIIKSVTMIGPYYCDSRNAISSRIQRSGTVHMFIMDPVANVSITMDKVYEDFTLGETVTLTCSILRGNSPSFHWFHNEKLIEQRQQMTSFFRSCTLQQLKTEKTNGQARTIHDPTNDIRASSSESGREVYSNIPSMEHVVCEDICYAHIGINKLPKVSPNPNQCKEEFSVTYSAIKTMTDTGTTQRTPNCTALYQNFSNDRFG